MNAQTVPVTLQDWISELLAAATVDDRRTVGVAASAAGFARAQVTCDRCQPRQVFFFTGAIVHLNAREQAHVEQHGVGTRLHTAGDISPVGERGAPVDGPVFWQTSHCRSCHAEVIWSVTTNGRRMPVDAQPNIAGNVVLVDQGVMNPPLAMVIHTEREQAEAPAEALHTSHFQSCPHAARHRRATTRKVT